MNGTDLSGNTNYPNDLSIISQEQTVMYRQTVLVRIAASMVGNGLENWVNSSFTTKFLLIQKRQRSKPISRKNGISHWHRMLKDTT